jgi:hypothetical protein
MKLRVALCLCAAALCAGPASGEIETTLRHHSDQMIDGTKYRIYDVWVDVDNVTEGWLQTQLHVELSNGTFYHNATNTAASPLSHANLGGEDVPLSGVKYEPTAETIGNDANARWDTYVTDHNGYNGPSPINVLSLDSFQDPEFEFVYAFDADSFSVIWSPFDFISDPLAVDTPFGQIETGAFEAPTARLTISADASGVVAVTVGQSFEGGPTSSSNTETFLGAPVYGISGEIAGGRFLPIDPISEAPVADANGGYDIIDGGDLDLDASGSVDTDITKYEWDLNGDGVFGDEADNTNPTPTVSAATLSGLSIPLNVPIGVAVRVTDADGTFDTDFSELTIFQVAEGDMNLDGSVTTVDIALFKLALLDPAEYTTFFDGTEDEGMLGRAHGDMNGDGSVTTIDIALFKEALLAVDPASSGALASLNSVPEPSSLLLLSLGLIGLLTSRRRRMR